MIYKKSLNTTILETIKCQKYPVRLEYLHLGLLHHIYVERRRNFKHYLLKISIFFFLFIDSIDLLLSFPLPVLLVCVRRHETLITDIFFSKSWIHERKRYIRWLFFWFEKKNKTSNQRNRYWDKIRLIEPERR